MNEDTARKYCIQFAKQPSSTVGQIYRDCTSESIVELVHVLSNWCYLASENDIALLDNRIPLTYLQLYQFAHDLGSLNKNPKIVCARCRTVLRSESIPKESLKSLVKVLCLAETTCEVLFFRAIVEVRLSDLQNAAQYFINGVTCNNDVDEIFCTLFSFDSQDLERMKSILLALKESTHLENNCESGLTNNGYIDDYDSVSSGIGSSVVSMEIDQQKEKYLLKDIIKSVEALEMVLNCKMGIKESTVELASRFARKGYLYKATCMLLNNFADCTTISGLDDMDGAIRCDLFQFSYSVASSLFVFYSSRKHDDYLEDKTKEEHDHKRSDLWDEERIFTRGLSYSRLAMTLEPTSIKAITLIVRFLIVFGQPSEARAICQSKISCGLDCDELKLYLAWCYFHENQMEDAMNELNSIPSDTSVFQVPCLKVMLNLLKENGEFPFNDLSIACKNHLHSMVETACFVGNKGLNRIKLNVPQLITSHISTFLPMYNPENTPGGSVENQSLSYDQSECGDIVHVKGSQAESNFFSNKEDDFLNLWENYKPIIDFLLDLYQYDLDIHLVCCEVYIFFRKYDKAQECLINLVHRDPKELLTIVHLANLRMRLGAYVAATEDFCLLLRALGPSNLASYLLYLSDIDRNEIARVHRQHAFKYLRQNSSYTEAVECFTVAITAVGTVGTGLLLARGICYTHLQNYYAALQDFTMILKENSTNVAALLGKAVMQFIRHEERTSLEELDLALELDTITAVKTAHKLPLPCIQTFISSLRSVLNSKLKESASTRTKDDKDSALKIVKIAKFLYTLFPLSEKDFFTYMESLFFSGQNEIALEELGKAEATIKSSGLLYSWRGLVLFRTCDQLESIDSLRKIKEADVDNCRKVLEKLRITERQHLRTTCVTKATELRKEGCFTEALEMYRIAMATLSRNDLRTHRARYECFCKLQDKKSALSELNTIVTLSDSPDDFCRRALCHLDMGTIREACNDFSISLELDPTGAIEFLKHQNQLRVAVQAFQTAAQLYLQEENPAEVIKVCYSGLKLSKNDKLLKQLRARARHSLTNCCVQ